MVVPLLTMGFDVDFHYAMGASAIAVIATSSGAASAYIKEGITNMRIGMFLEIATTVGAIIGAYTAVYMKVNVISIIFGLLLLFSAGMSVSKKLANEEHKQPGPWALRFKLIGSYPTAKGSNFYTARNIIGGFFMMLFAGVIAGLLGIGSGALKVIAMDNIMRLPFKVSTTTSNFMIGVTASVSAIIYFQKGYIIPDIAAPVMLGVLIGAMAGAKLLIKVNTKWLRRGFAIVITCVALIMINKGLK